MKGGSDISCSWVNECISDLRIALSMTAHMHCCYTGRRDSPVPYIFLLLSSIRSKRPFLAHHYHGSDILARPPKHLPVDFLFTCPDVPSQELIPLSIPPTFSLSFPIISPTSSALPELKAQFSTNHASTTDAINFPGPLVPPNTPRQAHYDDLLQPDSNTYENIRAQDCKKDDIILMKPYDERLEQLC